MTDEARAAGIERGAAADAATGGKPPRPAPLDPPMVPLALAGMVIWAVVGLALLPARHRLAEAGHGSWLWICLAGFLWGIPGLLTMIKHDANRRRRRAAAPD